MSSRLKNIFRFPRTDTANTTITIADTEPQVYSPLLRACVGSLLLAYKVLRTLPWTNKNVKDVLLNELADKLVDFGEGIEKAPTEGDRKVRSVNELETGVTDCLRVAWDCAEDVYELGKLSGAKEFLSRHHGLEVLRERFNMILFSVLLWYASPLLFNITCFSVVANTIQL